MTATPAASSADSLAAGNDCAADAATASGAWPTRMVAVPGARLRVFDSGGAGVPIVLLHANTGTLEAWSPQVAALTAAGHRVIAFDRRGWGHSVADPASGPQPGSIAGDLDALVAALKLERFNLLGIAGGGFAALDYAAWRPERLIKLIIAGSNGQFTEAAMQDFYARIAVPGLTGRLEVRPYLEVGVAYRAENPAGFAAFIAMEHAARQPDAPAQPLRTPNTFAKMTGITTPTLILMGGADLLAPPALMRFWSQHLLNVRHSEIGDAGHSINWERPAAFNARVIEFLAV